MNKKWRKLVSTKKHGIPIQRDWFNNPWTTDPFHSFNVLKKPLITTFKEYFSHKVIWKPNVATEIFFFTPTISVRLFKWTQLVTPLKKGIKRLQLCVSGWKILLKRPLKNTGSVQVWIALLLWFPVAIPVGLPHTGSMADLWLWLFFVGLISARQLRPSIAEFPKK